MEYLALADEHGVLRFPPVFVAAKLDCVPTIQPQQVDSCSLLKKLVDLERGVDKHDELLRGPQLHPATKEDQTTSETEQLSASAAIGGSAEEGSDTVSDAAKTWSSMAAGASSDGSEFIYPNRHKPKQKTH